jgi:hypothetical protein
MRFSCLAKVLSAWTMPIAKAGVTVTPDDVAIKKLEAFREAQKATFVLSGDYAKWFISTLLLLHSGAIAALIQRGDFSTQKVPAIAFGAGILLALFAGMAGWLNLQWASAHYRDLATALLAATTGPADSLPACVVTARRTAVCCASASMALLVGGAGAFASTLWGWW